MTWHEIAKLTMIMITIKMMFAGRDFDLSNGECYLKGLMKLTEKAIRY